LTFISEMKKKNHLTILTIQAKYGRVQILTTRYTF